MLSRFPKVAAAVEVPSAWIIEEVERSRREREERDRPRVSIDLPLPPPGWEPEVPAWRRPKVEEKRGVVVFEF